MHPGGSLDRRANRRVFVQQSPFHGQIEAMPSDADIFGNCVRFTISARFSINSATVIFVIARACSGIDAVNRSKGSASRA